MDKEAVLTFLETCEKAPEQPGSLMLKMKLDGWKKEPGFAALWQELMIEADAAGKQPLEPAGKTDDPAHRTSINVCYARTPGGRDVSDYVYPEGRVEKLQKVYLDFRGEVTLNKDAGYTFQSIESFDIILDCVGAGTIRYKASPKENVHYYGTDNGFAFVLPAYWGDEVPDSVMYGNRLYYLEAEICFRVNELKELQYIEVSSEAGLPLRDTHYTYIKPIRLF